MLPSFWYFPVFWSNCWKNTKKLDVKRKNVDMKWLTPSSRSSLLYKSMDWFLYCKDLRHERVNAHSKIQKLNTVQFFFKSIWFSFTSIYDSQDSQGSGRRSLSLLSFTPIISFTTSTRFTDILTLAGRLLQSSPQYIASSRIRNRNLWLSTSR